MTTIVADRVNANVYDTAARSPYFSWGAALAGAVAAAMVSFMLLALGAGMGLMLAGPVNDPAPLKTILTAGGIYFFAVEAFGFAVGGYIAGHMCGPVVKWHHDELVRSAIHGLVVWAVATAALVGLLAIGAAATAAGGLAALGMSQRAEITTAPTTAAYWADTLLRVPPQPRLAAPAGPILSPQPAPAISSPTDQAPLTPDAAEAPLPSEPAPNAGENESGANTNADETGNTTNDTEPPPPIPSPAVWHVPADIGGSMLTRIQYNESAGIAASDSRRVDFEARAEITRILSANALALDKMPADDRQYVEQTVAAQTGISRAEAHRRLEALVARVNRERDSAAETARKAAAYMNIWLALSLFFGLLIATASAVLARWEEEKEEEEAAASAIAATRVEPALRV